MRICLQYSAIVGVGLGVLAIAPGAWAHGVNVTHSTGEAVRVQALFASGEPMATAQVSVFAPDDAETPWIIGTTDPAGNFAFVPDPAQSGRWEVQVRLAGHGEIVYVPLEGSSVVKDSAVGVSATALSSDLTVSGAPVSRSASLAIASPPRSPAGLSLGQKLVMGAVFAWGCFGTALYFKRGAEVTRGTAA